MRKLLAIAALLTSSMAAPLPVVAQTYEPPEEIFCWEFYPGATYEELLILCADDVPPGGGGGGGGGGGPGPEYPGGSCPFPSRTGPCGFEQP